MKYGIIKKIYGQNEIEGIQYKINMLGSNRKLEFNSYEFLNLRLITTILFSIVLLLLNFKYYMIPFITILYYFMFYYYLISLPLKKRSEKLDREALTFFEVLTLTLQSGKNLENAIETTVMNVNSELSNEFKACLYETKMGKSLMEALTTLNKRIPSETINSIILNILETSEFGNSIVDVMKNEVEYLREKQILEVKGQINKIPNKVSIISVIFIIPLILLIILGPFIIDFIG